MTTLLDYSPRYNVPKTSLVMYLLNAEQMVLREAVTVG